IAEAAEAAPVVRRTADRLGGKLAWNPDRDAGWKIEALGHDADDWVDAAFRPQLDSREIRSGAEIAPPIAIAHDGGGGSVEALLVGCKRASTKRLDAKGLEEAARDFGPVDADRLAAAGK